jgi:hypothetical protein
VTDESRRRQITKELQSRDEQAAAERRSHPLRWRGHEKYFPVIDLSVDVPLLNAESHRIRADLEAPEYDFVRKERTSDEAQAALTALWRKAHRKFDKLKESLDVEGQREPGVVTREGILINGNTRLIALRELGQQWIRVAVLDSNASPPELADLELELQVRETGHDTYRLSNELLFIHEMKWEYHKTDEEIAKSLNWTPARPAIGKKKVLLFGKLLDLVRELQGRDDRLQITFFDDEGRGSGKLQQLKELEQRYSELVASGEMEKARLLLDTWLVVARSGYASVHQIRAVTQRDDFVDEFLIPRLGEQEMFGDKVEVVVGNEAPDKVDVLPGVDDLDTDVSNTATDGSTDLSPLLQLVVAEDGTDVTVPGSETSIPAQQVKAAVRAAVDGAIRDSRAENRAEDALQAPVDAMRKASRELKKATDAYKELRGTKDFERQVRGAFEYQFRLLRKHAKALDALIAGKGDL